MKLVRKNFGFTMVEIVVVLGLVGVFGAASGAYMVNSFKESSKLADKTVVQASVTSLMNDLGKNIKEADVPSIDIVSENATEKVYQILKRENGILVKVNYKFDKNNKTVDKVMNNVVLASYQNIDNITLIPTPQNNGAEVKIEGESNQYNLSSKYYTRNTSIICAHNWVLNAKIQEPTCTEVGINEYMCTECGLKDNREIPALGHENPDNWEYNNTQHWKICKNCPEMVAPKQNHTIEDAKCTVCGYVVTVVNPEDSDPEDNEEPDDKGNNGCTHNWTREVTKEATCTVDGREVSTCSKCGKTEIKVINKLGHSSSDWQHNETYHWKKCSVCGDYTVDEAIHTYSGNICTVCGYQKANGGNNETCEHSYAWAKSKDNHYWACTVCGYIKNQGAHTFATAKSETQHYDACTVCGYIKNQGAHTFATAKSETQHYDACTVCGYIKNQGEHTFATAKSETKHYDACTVCGYIKNQGAHTFATAKSETQHYEACAVCGYIKNEGEHVFNWATTSVNHYRACQECGYITDLGTHKCVNNKCTVCGYED